MKNHEIIFSSIWVTIGVMMCVASASLRLGSWRYPGPGLYPFLIGCIIGGTSLVRVLILLPRQPQKFKFWSDVAGFRRLVTLYVLLGLYTAGLKYLGYAACTFLFFGGVFKLLGKKGWLFTLLVSLLISTLSYLIFKSWLAINLPRGFLNI